jgi:chromosome segregation protein
LPVSFRRLRIVGFKSFAEPTNVEILPGLTGIVGPNGCGKSNVVEALRWAMGESSARNLRGGEMEDVIFAGTTGRSARNIAEVTLFLEETQGVAPHPFHEQAELQIVRKIERGHGSAYRVNGREARARDVQTLFADLASGARASAMVSQGRVGALVGARAEDRRSVLEEAAGITGLHARRHEAELKLRAAEANMARADDLKAQLESQLGGLKRQARQASRYRTISGAIRDAEAELLSIQRDFVAAARAEAAARLHDAGIAVAAAVAAATAATTRATEAATVLPPLREAEALARTALERHRVEQERIAEAEQRARTALGEATRRLDTIQRDLLHAEQLQRDATTAEARLADEHEGLAAADTDHQMRLEALEAAATLAAEALRLAESEPNRATEVAAEANARANAANQMLTQTDQRFRRLQEQFTRLRDERTRVVAQQIDPALLERTAAEATAAAEALTTARGTLEVAEQARATTATRLSAAREAQVEADSIRARLAAESQALAEVLAVKDGERWPPMVDALTVPAGLEAALGAALGEELTSALDPSAARHWRELPAFDPAPSLPPVAVALDRLVKGPAALTRALSQIGLVDQDDLGAFYQSDLAPGQVLVSRAGAIWRWDGYTIRADTPTAAAVRLTQRNRLAGLRSRLVEAEAAAATARIARAKAEAAAQTATLSEQQARGVRRDQEQRLERARSAVAASRNQAATAVARLAAADDQLARITAERDEAETALTQARAVHAELPDIGLLRRAVDAARAALTAARTRDASARSEKESLLREHTARANRRRVIVAERAGWVERARDAAERVTDLAVRLATAQAELADLQAAPAAIAAHRTAALEALRAAEAEHRRTAEVLTRAIQEAETADHTSRAAESQVGSAREAMVRAESAREQADHAWGTVAERILERLGANPALPDPPVEVTRETEDKARRKLDRLLKEREEMGPVNLRAEVEARAVEEQVATVERDRDELTTAIAKLRGSIGHLNREGRERLNAVFQAVDRNFQQLFARMFGGGRAHLALVGSDDPLEAGLEIYAQPPGKKLATLSLLSGGEQALTALSLIFAVFRCNPAPVCVLDEVDAPLDDANVERFCLLLADMVRETGTRFLVVTHHPLTMARMDRLYGVTMQERGVSRLLSVDLAQAELMLDAPAVAAA